MSIKDRIRKLLNIARDDAASECEIETAMRFAAKLMDEHRLTEADLQDGHDEQAAQERMVRDFAACTSNWMSFWEGHLGMFLCELIGTIGCYRGGTSEIRTPAGILVYGDDGKPMKRARLAFYGPDEDVTIAIAMFNELKQTIAAMGRLKFGGAFVGDGRAYCEGFVSGLFRKLKADRDAERSAIEAGARAIVAINRDKVDAICKATRARSEAFITRELGGKLGSGGSSRRRYSSAEAYRSGRSDGERTGVSVKRAGKLGAGSLSRLN